LLERASESLGMPMSTILRLAVSQALSDGIKGITSTRMRLTDMTS